MSGPASAYRSIVEVIGSQKAKTIYRYSTD
jgi:hypothetical protein